jgi:mannose-6-phosphate isomerase-like protein (cupin superfamily)
MKLILTALLVAGFAAPAGDPAGFHLWKTAELKAFTKTLAPKMNASKTAVQQLTSFGNYSFLALHREASGEAEYHATQADIFVVESGQATLIYGGAMVDGKTTTPNEMRCPSISGGMETTLGVGDVVTIPAKMPHQIKLDAGQEVTYFMVKVTQ